MLFLYFLGSIGLGDMNLGLFSWHFGDTSKFCRNFLAYFRPVT